MRLIDADALWERLNDEPWENNADRDDIALPIVNAAPPIDAVIVTRCKDCKYLVNEVVNANGFLICDVSDMEIAPDDFCSYGKRKDGGDKDDR